MPVVKVRIFKRSGRKFFEAQWTDPLTGLKKTRSTGETKRREAERFAARLENDIRLNVVSSVGPISWSDLKDRYRAEVMPGQADSTAANTESTFNAIDEFVAPKLAQQLNADAISRFQAEIRKSRDISDASIRRHLSELRKVLRFAKRLGLIHAVPDLGIPKSAPGMKGRPITGEEFDRMIEATPLVVGKVTAASWQHMIRGLYLSGLRLAESMLLHWVDDTNLAVDLSGRRPMIRIQAHAEKGRQYRMLPITPDFAEFLEETPECGRDGFVFNPLPQTEPLDERLTHNWVSKVISKIGKKANIVVQAKGEDRKYASAHDLRRSFGERWSQRLMPITLKELMRHKDISTTLAFYVGRSAESAADAVWSASANKSANTPDLSELDGGVSKSQIQSR